MQADITIIGAGLVGMTAACALGGLGLGVVVIDSADLQEVGKKASDGRTCAIAAGSAAFFQEIGAWDELQPNAGEIRDIRVTDGNSPLFLHYDHALVGDAPMGYIIENYHLRKALFNRAAQLPNIRIIAPEQYTAVIFGDVECAVTLSSGTTVKSQLLIAADGKNSNIRRLADIKTDSWSYGQSGLVCTIAHERHHQFIAQERFLPEGPFAVLPMAGGYHASLVWTEKNDLVPVYMAMEAAEIEEQITLRAGEYLGKIQLASRMFSYPLSLCKAKTYIGQRLALVGDAAHAMHPLAGQGFNVGIRDIADLTGRLKATGNNIPAAEILQAYNAARMLDSITLLGITDILNRAFSNNIFPLRTARRLGMAAINQTKPLKKFFMRHAMGA